MKTKILLTSSFFWLTGFAFANTYAWENYDDFSGSTLDNVKWDLSCFDGGNLPIVSNGQVLLTGNTNSSWNDTIVTARMLATNPNAAVVLAGGGEAHSVLEFKESDDIYGIELYLTLPNDVSTDCGIGIYAIDYNAMFNGNEESSIRFDLDLWHGSGNPEVQVSWKNPSTGKEEKTSSITVSKGTPIKLAFIRNENGIQFFYNDQSIAKGNYKNVNETFFVRAVSETGATFANSVDNVRVLRKATTTSLDGSIFILSSTDGVSETMSFENGTFTSSFVDSQKITTITSNQSYILDSMSSNSWKITLNDGDVYSFDSSTGTGTLTDYENGVIDTSGTWTFTYTRNTWMDYDDFSDNSLDTTKWEVGYFAGGETVTIVNGQAQLSGSAYSSSSPSQMPSDFANAGQDATEGNTFLFIKDATIIGLEADIMIPNTGNQNEAGVYLTTLDSNPFGSLGFELRKTATGSSFNYSYFDDQGSKIRGYEAGSLDTFHKIKMTELNGQTSYYLDNKLIKQFASTSHDTDYWGIGSFNDYGLAYTTYADNVRVLRNWEDYDDFSGTSLDTSKWDISKRDGGEFPVLDGGKLKFTGQPNSSSSVNVATSAMLASSSNVSYGSSSSTSPHSILEFKESLNLKGIELTFSIPSGVPNQMGFGLYATNYQAMFNSQSDSEEESAIPFNMDLWADNSLAATLEFDAKDPTSGIEQGIDKSISFDSSYRVSFIRGDSQISFYMNGELVGKFPYSDVGEYFIVRAMNEINQPFTTYLDNVRVLRRSTTTTQPDPVTVVSDPNGHAVVVQVGNEYQWNTTLDGIKLWSVWQESDGTYSDGTMKFSGTTQLLLKEGLVDAVTSQDAKSVTYVVDGNGYLVESGEGYSEYYNVKGVENSIANVISSDQGSAGVVDNGTNQVNQWFFTTRAAADEYYYSKVNPKDWLWFDQYPWVYSNERQDWLYFMPSGGKLMYYSHKYKVWREFSH